MKIYFYPEYSKVSGQGHLKRLMALNEYVCENFSTSFIFKTEIPKDFKYDFLLLPNSSNYKRDIDYLKNEIISDSVLVLDGYIFHSSFQEQIKKRTLFKLVYIDDLGGHFPFADVVVNHAPGVKKTDYHVNPKTKLLLGLDYLLLREAFFKKNSIIPSIQFKSVFVCFGGCDTENFSKTISEELVKLPKVKRINLVFGDQYPFSKKWVSDKKIKVLENLSADKVKHYMKKSNLIIVPSSTLVLESLCIGRPIITIKTSKNQNFIFKGLKKYKHVYRFQEYNSKTKKLLSQVVLKYLTDKNFEYEVIKFDSRKKYNKIFQSF